MRYYLMAAALAAGVAVTGAWAKPAPQPVPHWGEGAHGPTPGVQTTRKARRSASRAQRRARAQRATHHARRPVQVDRRLSPAVADHLLTGPLELLGGIARLPFLALESVLDVISPEAYLFQVYERTKVKRDQAGDFTWKDPAAARRLGMPVPDYVIGGMHPDLREVLNLAARAVDEAGICMTILSGFRDDYRQKIAAGIKARTGYSRHGGSRATRGYGDGRAVDVWSCGNTRPEVLFRWIDRHGPRYGLYRPYRGFDPGHVEPRGRWTQVARAARAARSAVTAEAVIPVPRARPPERVASRR